jgi:hypothetical protein
MPKSTATLALILSLAAALPAPSFAAVNTADAGVQLAISRPREVAQGAPLLTTDGRRLGQVIRVTRSPRGFIESVEVRDRLGVVREISAVDVYLRRGRLVTDMPLTRFQAAPQLQSSRNP